MEVIAGTSEELIRRSDAIKAIEPYLDYIESITLCGAKPYVREAIYGIRSKIKFIPTIEPKRGRWKIKDAETIYGKAYLLTCSECGETVSVTETALPYEHFCRNCGADMREVRNE